VAKEKLGEALGSKGRAFMLTVLTTLALITLRKTENKEVFHFL
jgi:hypothetical protein